MNGLDTRSYALRRVQGERIPLPPAPDSTHFHDERKTGNDDWNLSELLGAQLDTQGEKNLWKALR